MLDRRTFLKLTGTGVLVLVSGGAVAACDTPAPEVKVGSGFSARVIATSGECGRHGVPLARRPRRRRRLPHVRRRLDLRLELRDLSGRAGSMVRFAAGGAIVEARRILGGTSLNCAGGATPWGTWLSCEEHDNGQVYECDPAGVNAAVVRPAMGRFRHEAAAVDPVQPPDLPDRGPPARARCYRFLPTRGAISSEGRLQVLTESAGHARPGRTCPPRPPRRPATRDQVARHQAVHRRRGHCCTGDSVCFTTKGDNKVWRYDPPTHTLTVVYDPPPPDARASAGSTTSPPAPAATCTWPRTAGTWRSSGSAWTASVHPVAQVAVTGSEITGPAFSPDGTRLYFTSQRNPGTTYEVRGPF